MSEGRLGNLEEARKHLHKGCTLGSHASCGNLALMLMEKAVVSVRVEGPLFTEVYRGEEGGERDWLMLDAWRYAEMGCPMAGRMYGNTDGKELGTGRGGGKGPKVQCNEQALVAMGLGYMYGFESTMCGEYEGRDQANGARCLDMQEFRVAKDIERAVRYISDGADGGDPKAWYYFGLLKSGFMQPEFVRSNQSQKDAANSFMIAAGQGVEGAIYR